MYACYKIDMFIPKY